MRDRREKREERIEGERREKRDRREREREMRGRSRGRREVEGEGGRENIIKKEKIPNPAWFRTEVLLTLRLIYPIEYSRWLNHGGCCAIISRY